MESTLVLTIYYPTGAKKVINTHPSFLLDNKNKKLSIEEITNKVISIVQDELKIKYVPKECYSYKILK
jgi:hypothetical protein